MVVLLKLYFVYLSINKILILYLYSNPIFFCCMTLYRIGVYTRFWCIVLYRIMLRFSHSVSGRNAIWRCESVPREKKRYIYILLWIIKTPNTFAQLFKGWAPHQTAHYVHLRFQIIFFVIIILHCENSWAVLSILIWLLHNIFMDNSANIANQFNFDFVYGYYRYIRLFLNCARYCMSCV